MYSELDDKIKKAREGIARLHKIDSMLERLERDEEELRGKEDQLKVIMEKEKYDVEKLENGGVASLFYSILGNLDERVEKERKEALAAKLKYDQVVRDLNDIRFQISELSSERTGYLGCQEEYDRLYSQKREALMKEAGGTAQRLNELAEDMNLAEINLKEIREAISAGEEVLYGLERVLNRLNSAEGWGTFDLLGGGLISDLAKHSHLDDAKLEVERTQSLLRRFKTELADMEIHSDIIMETDGFAKFADFFFDGLIADWFMQSRISQSQDSVFTVKTQVENVMGGLKHFESQEESNMEKLAAESDRLVLNG